MMKNIEKKVIGWREYVDLPDWGIKLLKAKIDTGAKSCSLHVEDVKELSDGKISFYIILGRDKKSKRIIALPERKGKVKSSIGARTHRWFIQTKIKIGNVERLIKVNLTDRREMNFRMLIGRTAIDDYFLVDVAHGYLLKKKKSKPKVKNKKRIMKKKKTVKNKNSTKSVF